MGVCSLCAKENGHFDDCPSLKQKTAPRPSTYYDSFPPHWFTVFRFGSNVTFQLTPCNVAVPTVSWRLYPDSLRVSDLAHVIESLKAEPENVQLVLCYVDSIDSATYLMESARTTLALFKDSLETLFKPMAPVNAVDLGPPPEPAPEGDPGTYTMEELKADMARIDAERHGVSPVPYGTDHQFPQGDKSSRQTTGESVE